MNKKTYSKSRYAIVDKETGEIIRDLARKPYPGPRKARLRFYPLGYYSRQQLLTIADFILALICVGIIILAFTQF